MGKIQDRLWSIGIDIFLFILCVIIIALIPGLLWLASGVILGVAKFIDTIIIKFNEALFSLGIWLWVIYSVLGLGFYIWVKKRHARSS